MMDQFIVWRCNSGRVILVCLDMSRYDFYFGFHRYCTDLEA